MIPSAQHAVRPIAVTQREVLTDFVSGCFTGLCFVTAMNGFDPDSDGNIAHLVPKSRLIDRDVRWVTVHAA